MINAFSFDQRTFKNINSTDVSSWALSGDGNGDDSIRIFNISLYSTYTPNIDSPYSLNSIGVRALNLSLSSGHDVNDIVITSPLVEVVGGYLYSFSIASLPIGSNISFTFDADFFSIDGNDLIEKDGKSIDFDVLDGRTALLMNYFVAPVGAYTARIKVSISGYRDESLKNGDTCAFFDPVVCDISPTNIPYFSETVYNSLPSFMKLDDININSILSSDVSGAVAGFQMELPLRRFTESLLLPADKIYSEVNEFRYDRTVDGVEHKSKLTDPDTADPSYLEWLALITGSKLFTVNTGFSSWIAIENYDGLDDNTIPGEWNDIEQLADWRSIENLNPNIFNSVQGYRDQIRTGATGINAGRPDSIVEFLRTMLDSDTRDTDVVVLSNEYTDNPFRVKLLVDPDKDPDPLGELLVRFSNKVASVGSSVVKETKVINSGRGSYKLEDALYPNTLTNTSAAGSVIYGQPFISDYEFSGQNIVLNKLYETDKQPEFGGGVGASHFSQGSAYYFGWIGDNDPGSLTVDTSTVTNLGGLSDYDVIAVLTDVVPPVAAVYTDTFSVSPSSISPSSFLFREKRLIVCGTDDDGLGNDWALYIVSGISPSPDSDTRLLFIDGYRTQSKTHYAYSDPIDPSFFAQHRDVCVRFSKQGNSFKFYVQNSLYDDWETHSVGSGSFTPVSSSAGTRHGVQVLGKLDNSDWSDATGLSCAVKRVMIFNHSLVFNDESVVSDSAHAVCNSGVVQDFGVYSYQPTIDIDLVDVSLYAESFNAVTYNNSEYGAIVVNVNSASPSDDYAWFDGSGLRLPGVVGNFASTVDSTALDITADMEVVVRAKAVDWTPTSVQALVSKWTGGLTQRSYAFQLSTSGLLIFSICDGLTNFSVGSSVALPGVNGTAYWLKSTYVKDTGSGQYAVDFYYANDSVAEPTVWTKLGTTITGASIGDLRNSTTALLFGGIYAGTSGMFNGTIYRSIIRSGVGGTVVLDSDFSQVPEGTNSFNEDSTNNATVTLTTTYGQVSQNDVDILAMRPQASSGGELWHFGKTYGSGNGDTLTVSGLPLGVYDYVVHEIVPYNGSVDSSRRFNGTSNVTSITLSADLFNGDTILAVEVMLDEGTPGTPPNPGANTVAYFLPSTINASATIGTDEYGKTWTLNRTWPSGGTYSPSQVINKPCIHMYTSSPKIVNNLNSNHSFNFEHWKSFSILLHVRRVWTGVEGDDVYKIFNVDYGNEIGLRVFYDGPKIKAVYSDGVSTELVEWVENPIFGDWHRVILRRNGETFDMVVDGVTVSSTPVVLSIPFPDGDPEKYLSSEHPTPWNPRFALAHFSFFDRYLSDGEIALLESEIS